MRALTIALAAAFLLPVTMASHPVNHDPLGFQDPDGPLLAETCAQTVFDDAPPFPEVPLGPPCEGAGFLAEAAADGYVLQVQRTAPATFHLRVRHGLDIGQGPMPLGAAQVALAGAARECPDAAACNSQGVWVHAAVGDDGNAFTGQYYPQRITPAADGLSWTLTVTGAPASAENVALVVVVELASGEWARGFYHPAKLSAPVDLLDAVPYPTLL